ncbi:iron-containing alcohol dehydrogenase [Agrobacterium tumefaciens]|uniref:iron-containing alcohol dehydrogenase n=1 Tax=Agrobacterium tumefaciens TaxID=358 RepID=UPI0012B914F5|nr:iron-containing alcohol dehydrogenase [Agrobacterium tumefaciens]MQB07299.1 iron-containing alcohol dehydrogenase [Agrobacterium tumefaciens]
MLNFSFYNPTRIVFGRDTIKSLDDLVPQQARVLVLYGGSSARANGTLDQVKAVLGTRDVQEFGGIEANPTFETLMHAVEQVRNEGRDFLLAVGGGSVIDGTKFVSAAVHFEGDAWQILEQHGANIKSAVPFGAVLTLPATGSEMNRLAVISRTATHQKLDFASELIFPQFSVLDPTKTETLPERQIANGIADAFTHVFEQYLTYPINAAPQDRFSEGLLKTLIELGANGPGLANYEARANLMWASTLALNGLIGAGVPQDWSTHMIGHELTALHGIDHARTLAMVFPASLEVRREAKREKLLQYGERVWGIAEGEKEDRIDQAIVRTREFFEKLGIPTRLSAYNLGSDAIGPVLQQLEAHGMTALGESKDVTIEVSRKILEAAL